MGGNGHEHTQTRRCGAPGPHGPPGRIGCRASLGPVRLRQWSSRLLLFEGVPFVRPRLPFVSLRAAALLLVPALLLGAAVLRLRLWLRRVLLGPAADLLLRAAVLPAPFARRPLLRLVAARAKSNAPTGSG